MNESKYPIGIQTFSNLIEEGYSYVDKTQFIKPLLKQGKFIFLSRPRRFGKSLFVTTLKAFFMGKRELFKGLAIDSEETDWTPSPVFHIDLNPENYSLENGLELRLDSILREYERLYGRDPDDISPSQRFAALIRNAYEKKGRKVVILIDEYDKPLLELQKDKALLEKNQKILKSFFGNLKSMEEYIRFAFLTGVARFGKVSIFSDLNNLKDISLDDRFAEICGWTEEEVTANFNSGIKALAEKRATGFDTMLDLLRNYYDGYLFSPEGRRLYNPFSILQALDSKSIEPYWFETATPTFLVRMIRENLIDPMEINGRRCDRRELKQVSLYSRNPIPLMFQTGYLTIDSYDSKTERFTLRFPNREVEKAFAQDLLPLYIKDADDSSSAFSLYNFQDDLLDGNPKAFMDRLATLFKELPFEDQSEGVYRAITYLLCRLTTLDVHAEQHSYKGRSDLEVVTPDYIYIFEFKFNRNAHDAMRQMLMRDYAGRFAMDERQVFFYRS